VDQFFGEIGMWFWWIIAGLLLIAEMLMPGFFMLWLAVAAALTAITDYVFHLSWIGEIFTFAAFGILSILGSWRFVMGNRHPKSDQPFLNQRHEGLVGQSFYLETAITYGKGKIKVDDTLWDVEGPDLHKGKRVKVTATSGLRLMVEKA
jgi:membrane protein implicated in regulation of membrane protease activity